MPPDEYNSIIATLGGIRVQIDFLLQDHEERKSAIAKLNENMNDLREALACHSEFITLCKERFENDRKIRDRAWAIGFLVAGPFFAVLWGMIKEFVMGIYKHIMGSGK